jgi:transposase
VSSRPAACAGPRCWTGEVCRDKQRDLTCSRKVQGRSLCVGTQHGGYVGSRRECTRILGLKGYRVEAMEWEGEGSRARLRVWIERGGICGHECWGCGRRTWRVREARAWDDLPWAEHRVMLIYRQRRELSDVRRSHRADHVCRCEGPRHASAATSHWPRLSVDANLARGGAAKCKLEQSAPSRTRLSRGVGSRSPETPAAIFGGR